MIDGLGKWLAQFGAYASIWPKLSVAAKVSFVAFVSLAIVLARYFNRVADRKGAAPWAMLGAACVLIVGPGILQAPVAAQNALPLTREMSWVEFAMQARLYYVTAAGIAPSGAGCRATNTIGGRSGAGRGAAVGAAASARNANAPSHRAPPRAISATAPASSTSTLPP